MKTTKIVPFLLAIAGLVFCTAGIAADQPQSAAPLKPITKKLTFIYIPKLVHPWYEEVKRGVEYGIQEVKKEGIDVEYIWDAPAQADVDEENKKIEAAISRKPDGLCVSCLDPATNAQMLDEAIAAHLNVLTFNATGGPKYPFVGRNKDVEDGYICGKFVMEKLGKKGNVAILLGSLTAPEHQGRVQGFKKAIAECPNVKIVFEQPDNDNLEQAVSVTESALQATSGSQCHFVLQREQPDRGGTSGKKRRQSGKNPDWRI